MSAPLRLSGVLLAAALSGCASTAVEKQHRYVDEFAQANLGTGARWQNTGAAMADAQQRAITLLDAPLTIAGAVELALLFSPAFQATLADSAAASATTTQSARLPNPVFTFERLVRSEQGIADLDIGRMLSVSLLELIFLPGRIAAADAAQTQLSLRAASSAVAAATEARQAWVRAVAAAQSLQYAEQVMAAGEASAELAKRMYQVGNFSKLQRARQQAFYAEAAAQLARAQAVSVASREALVRALGLDSTLAAKLTLPPRLPDLPAQPIAEATVAQAALDQRLDVQMAKASVAAAGKRYGFDTATSFMNAMHAAAVRNSETGKPPQRGYELELALPVFDFGDARRLAGRAGYLAAMHRATQTAVDATSQVREQYARYSKAYDLAQLYRAEIVPLQKTIADETLLKYNGMLIGVFDLLAETRAQIGSVIQAIDAERDFWLADAALQATLLGTPMPGMAANDVAAGSAISTAGKAH
jgi:outer membrane protein TolC